MQPLRFILGDDRRFIWLRYGFGSTPEPVAFAVAKADLSRLFGREGFAVPLAVLIVVIGEPSDLGVALAIGPGALTYCAGFAQKGLSAQKLLNLDKKGSTGCEQHQSAGSPRRVRPADSRLRDGAETEGYRSRA